LGIYEDVNFNLDLPLEVPEIYIDMEIALAQARNNRSTIISLQRRLLEAEAQVESSKANTGLSGQLSGEVGLTGFGGNISDAYSTLTDQEVITLRLTIPIADWGKAKAAYEIQKSNYELVDLNTGLDRINFENEVKIAVQQFELVKENVELSKRSYELSQKRYDLTRKRYVIGKLDITELNLADIEQESQRQAYIQSINSFWDAYYNIRSLTLYDFINNTPLVKE
jgi:outer membrane protein TolC